MIFLKKFFSQISLEEYNLRLECVLFSPGTIGSWILSSSLLRHLWAIGLVMDQYVQAAEGLPIEWRGEC